MRRRASSRVHVALLIETSNRYGRDLLHGIHDWIAGGANWSVRLTEQSRLAPLPPWVEKWSGDGIIARVDSRPAAAALRRFGGPVVDVSDERTRSEFSKISIDNPAVATMAADYLRGKGLQHFGFCGQPEYLWSRARHTHYVAALRTHGHRPHVFQLQSSSPGSAHAEPAVPADLIEWLRQLPKPVGIFASYDSCAQRVLQACHEAGVSVPREVAVLGVDNDEVVCELSDPPLSSILPNARRAGFQAAQLLHELITRRTAAAPKTVSIGPVRVVERTSSDLAGVEDDEIAEAIRFIQAHACGGINVKDVLKTVSISRTLFERRFRAATGSSAHAMILEARLSAARRMLQETDLPLARIAELTGLSSPSYLSVMFKRLTGTSPLEFRKKRD